MKTNLRPDPCCPECGSALQIETNVVVDEPYLAGYLLRGAPLPRRERVAPAVAFCTGCEFAIEIRKDGTR